MDETIEVEDLDDLVKTRFKEVLDTLSPNEKKYFNPESIKNIIYHLIDNPQIHPKGNKRLQELGEIRMKKHLLEYFEAIHKNELNKDTSANFYKEYFIKIESFMGRYYGFSGGGSVSILISVFFIFFTGIILDLILNAINWTNFPLMTSMLFTLFIVRKLIKYNHRRVSGMFY
ncbi:hypothetical protein GCM10011344_01710 [Dokdonia pacifica]|uniref:Uncharacterized protein n=1 Tax=Dokdonia pacifica TaxID=1627892 RepID=A0A238ZAA0_9FLAO|nr:hypothetical protein [Dokdonia pacifica]GGG04992.1 hypothetical protein GCM10011344_01710 [Dokdonia pacifica]SNR79654.1 hypothetical protein SAMN06265376_10331 [Dokdonia pacifica]